MMRRPPKQMSLKHIVQCLALFTLSVIPEARGAASILNLLGKFNLITGDYLTQNETEGSAFVSGSYRPTGSNSRFGFNSGAVANDATNVLWLNNGISSATTGTSTLLSGSLVSRVAVNHSRFALNGNAPGTPSFNDNSTSWDTALASLGVNSAAELNSNLLAASSQWSGLAANSIGAKQNNGSFTFTATPTNINGHQVAVFNVSAATLFNTNGGFDRLDATIGNSETLIINVSGTGPIDINKNFTGGLQGNESKILFNFYEATSITVSRNFRGALYAPLATVAQGGTNIDGTVVAASFSQNAEVHNALFRSYLPFTPIPEPSVALVTGIGLLLTLRRRRSLAA